MIYVYSRLRCAAARSFYIRFSSWCLWIFGFQLFRNRYFVFHFSRSILTAFDEYLAKICSLYSKCSKSLKTWASPTKPICKYFLAICNMKEKRNLIIILFLISMSKIIYMRRGEVNDHDNICANYNQQVANHWNQVSKRKWIIDCLMKSSLGISAFLLLWYIWVLSSL